MSNVIPLRFTRKTVTEDERFNAENKDVMLQNLETMRKAIEEDKVIDLFLIGVGADPDDDVHAHSMGVECNPAAAVGMLEGLKAYIIHGDNLPTFDPAD